MRFRGRPPIFAVTVLAFLSACTSARHAAPTAAAKASPPAPALRLALDPEISPVAFRWLADDALLVAADVGPRKLASFGNYLERSAKVDRARLAVWDDESAWRANTADTAADRLHRAQAGALPERHVLAGSRRALHGLRQERSVAYERDFRSYPITAFDRARPRSDRGRLRSAPRRPPRDRRRERKHVGHAGRRAAAISPA